MPQPTTMVIEQPRFNWKDPASEYRWRDGWRTGQVTTVSVALATGKVMLFPAKGSDKVKKK